jgi:hypothetical protein
MGSNSERETVITKKVISTGASCYFRLDKFWTVLSHTGDSKLSACYIHYDTKKIKKKSAQNQMIENAKLQWLWNTSQTVRGYTRGPEVFTCQMFPSMMSMDGTLSETDF